MEVEISDLVDKIKNEGISVAKDEVRKMIAAAKAEAKSIYDEAQEEARQIRESANREAKILIQSGNAAFKQATRDLLITVRQKLEGLFDKLLQEEVSATLKGNNLQDLIVGVIKNSSINAGIELQLSESEIDALRDSLLAKLKKELKNSSIELKASADIKAGFRIGYKDGTAFYDFSDAELNLMLSHLLNPKFAAILQS